MNRQNDSDSFYREMFSLVIPIAFQSFMLALVSVTDALMLGFIDQESMASVSQAGQVQFLLNMLIIGFAAGTGIMAAQYWGKGDTSAIEKIAPAALRLVLIICGATTLATAFIPDTVMSILTNDATLIGLGASYLRAASPSYITGGITQVYFAILKNTGHAAKSSYIGSIAVVANIILNALLIFGLFGFPELGIVGAALATSISRIIELILAVMITLKFSSVQLRWRGVIEKTNPLLWSDFVRYSMPLVGAGMVWGTAFTGYSVIMGHMGADAVAANSVTAIAKNLTSCFIRGVGAGAGIMIGNVLGTGNMERARLYGRRFTILSILTGLFTALVLFAVTPAVLSLAPLSLSAREFLRIMMIFTGFNVMAQSINHVVLDGIFGSGGDAKFDMQTNIVMMWCITLPLGIFSAFVLKLPPTAIFCILNMDEIVKLPAVFIHYKKYIWLRNITRDDL